MSDLTREQRDALVEKIRVAEADLYQKRFGPTAKVRKRLRKAYYALLGEYGDRLPRRLFGRCPFSGAPFTRAFDPFGVDGPWWHTNPLETITEPTAPRAYKIHLGALNLGGRSPSEASEEVIPGPDAPFVVPRLLRLPGMVAVVTQLKFETSDRAWVISYWSSDLIPPVRLHQQWLRREHWFKNERGESASIIANDIWDFDLEPYLAYGRLRWIDPDDPQQRVMQALAGGCCPFLGIAGDHRPQVLADGMRDLKELPDGYSIYPFAD